jgi:hypothetical protein
MNSKRKRRPLVAGIYKWVTPVGSYVGQSIDIHDRRAQEAAGGSQCPKDLRKAFAVHGLAVCTFEIIEECAQCDFDAREKYWIKKYRTYEFGLNRTRGGQNGATRALQEYAAKKRKQTWPKYKALYSAHLELHGHLDVPYGEPVIGSHMQTMRTHGSFRAEFFRDFPGLFWESHSKRMWATYKPLYSAHLNTHGHLDVPTKYPIIGHHMRDMRHTGSFRAEFSRDFPGEFWESHIKRVWACKLRPLYKAHLDIHGHLNVSTKEPIIGNHMRNMRARGSFKKEFARDFPGQFWVSSKVKS